MGLSQSSKNLRERSNTSVPAGTTRLYGDAVPVQKYLGDDVPTRSPTTTP